MANSISPSKSVSVNKPQRYSQAKKVTLIGAMVNAFLGTTKLIAGIFGNSHALIADGVHSFSDLLTDALVLFAAKYSNREADIDHPYGHKRIETAATMLLALVLILAGVGISWDSLTLLFVKESPPIGYFIILVALLSIVANEALYHYTRFIGQRIKSDLILANAWHHRSDAASSIIVLIGLIAAQLGFSHLDSVAAIIVGIMIIKMGFTLGWNSIKELVDTGLKPAQLNFINQIIQQIDGVKAIHQLRTRSMAGQILVDVHVLVDEKISVSEGHHIAQNVHYLLMNQIESITDVTVHIDPEDDEICCPSQHLPSSQVLLPQLMHYWQQLDGIKALTQVTIHYINGEIHLELTFSQTMTQQLQDQYSEVATHFPDIVDIAIYLKPSKIRT